VLEVGIADFWRLLIIDRQSTIAKKYLENPFLPLSLLSK
jgi:hypothetical protein